MNIQISYIGALSEFEPIDGFLTAVKALKDRISLRFVGEVSPKHKEAIKSVTDNVEFLPRVSHSEAIKEMCSAGLLLLIVPECSYEIPPGKTFEYIGSGRPVLCLADPNGETADIIKNGKTFNWHDASGIEEFLRDYWK